MKLLVASAIVDALLFMIVLELLGVIYAGNKWRTYASHKVHYAYHDVVGTVCSPSRIEQDQPPYCTPHLRAFHDFDE